MESEGRRQEWTIRGSERDRQAGWEAWVEWRDSGFVDEVNGRTRDVEASAGYCVGCTPGDGERRGISPRRVGGGGRRLPRRC